MTYDIICFSHLRWNFVYQRPQHLLTRFAKERRVFVMEEPIYGATDNHLKVSRVDDLNVWIAVPHLVDGLDYEFINNIQRSFVDELISSNNIQNIIAWYYSPMPLSFSDHIATRLVVYDCMDELSAFNGAPPSIAKMEKELFELADIVFTGGHNLYKAKKSQHSNIFPIPSSIDKNHFALARSSQQDPADQLPISHPRIGFYGVIDERLNIDLVKEMAIQKPAWQFILIGPVVKIDPGSLPKLNNVHYLGGKSYSQLPAYLGGWDLAMMPFALNRSTQYISPTKTPEYLAGGKQVVSTSITDVVEPYGNEGLVQIADDATGFIKAIERALTITTADRELWLKSVDQFLSGISWDKTWQTMSHLISLTLDSKKNIDTQKKMKIYV